MKTAVTATSIDAFYTEVRCGREGSQKRAIFELMRRHGAPMTRQQIKDYSGYEINVVTGRVNALIKSGALQRCGEVETDHNGQPCAAREIVSIATPQLSLLDGRQGDPYTEVRA